MLSIGTPLFQYSISTKNTNVFFEGRIEKQRKNAWEKSDSNRRHKKDDKLDISREARELANQWEKDRRRAERAQQQRDAEASTSYLPPSTSSSRPATDTASGSSLPVPSGVWLKRPSARRLPHTIGAPPPPAPHSDSSSSEGYKTPPYAPTSPPHYLFSTVPDGESLADEVKRMRTLGFKPSKKEKGEAKADYRARVAAEMEKFKATRFSNDAQS